MDKNFYLLYYDLERNHWWFKARNRILINLVKKYNQHPHPPILNIGVATGYTSVLLEPVGEVTSVEYDEDTCNFLRNDLDLNAVHASILDLPFEDESFDIVCAFDVIEHVKEDKRAVDEMIRVCRKNGLIAISVPAFQSLWSDHDRINHHVKRYREQELKKLFDKTETIGVYSTYFNFFLFLPIAIARLMGSLLIKKGNQDHAESDFVKFKSNPSNKLLYRIFLSEWFLIKLGLRLFPGISIVTLFRKK
jgi:SAM-dependent methyltransferase